VVLQYRNEPNIEMNMEEAYRPFAQLAPEMFPGSQQQRLVYANIACGQ
jgi:hypothetical protein